MDPNSGRIISDADLTKLRINNPDDAARFTVRLEGDPEEIEKVAAAVGRDVKRREVNRRKNKAARNARKSGR